MPRALTHYSVWYLASDGTFGKNDFVEEKTIDTFRRNARLFFEQKPDVAARCVVIYRDPKTNRALQAEIMSNGIEEPRLESLLARKLSEIGLDAKGKIKRSRTSLQRIAHRKRSAKKRPAKASVRTVHAVLGRIASRKTPEPCRTNFANGYQFVISPGVHENCRPHDFKTAISRFLRCDWGDVPIQTIRKNNRLTREPKFETIIGSYTSPASEAEFWIMANPMTERALLLMPYEYHGK